MEHETREWRIMYTVRDHWGGPPDADGNLTLIPYLFWEDTGEELNPRMLADLLEDCRYHVGPELVDAWLEFRMVAQWTPVDREVRAGDR